MSKKRRRNQGMLQRGCGGPGGSVPQPTPATPAGRREGFRLSHRWVRVAALCACAGLVLLLRLHGLDLPLDSDEGAYGHIAQRLLAGDTLYKDVADNKPPGVYLTYALGLWLFGNGDHSIRWMAILFSWASLAAVYACARRLFGSGAALWMALLFCLLNVEPRTHGHIAKIEVFAAPLLLGALALALRYRETRRTPWLALAALCLGAAASYKPWFALHIAPLMTLAWRGPLERAGNWPARLGRWGVLAGAAALPCLLWLGWLMATSDLAATWDSLVTFNAQMMRTARKEAGPLAHWLSQLLGLSAGAVWSGAWLVWWWAGTVSAMILAVRRDTAETPGWRWLGIWTLVALLEVTSGEKIGTYYFGPILPLAAMAVAGVARLGTARWPAGWHGFNAALGLLAAAHVQTNYLGLNNSQILKAMWGYDFYMDFRELGEKLRPRVPPGERVYVWGADPINFYSQRASASRYFFLAPSGFDEPRMTQLMDEVIRNRPMIFYENLAFPPMPARLKDFVQREYEVVYRPKLFALYVLKEKLPVWWAGVRRAEEIDRAAESRRLAP